MPRKLKFQHRKKRARDARLSTKASCSSKDVHESKCDVSSEISSSTQTESPEVGSVSDTSSEMSSLTSSESQWNQKLYLSRHHLRMLILH